MAAIPPGSSRHPGRISSLRNAELRLNASASAAATSLPHSSRKSAPSGPSLSLSEESSASASSAPLAAALAAAGTPWVRVWNRGNCMLSLRE